MARNALQVDSKTKKHNNPLVQPPLCFLVYYGLFARVRDVKTHDCLLQHPRPPPSPPPHPRGAIGVRGWGLGGHIQFIGLEGGHWRCGALNGGS